MRKENGNHTLEKKIKRIQNLLISNFVFHYFFKFVLILFTSVKCYSLIITLQKCNLLFKKTLKKRTFSD